MRIRRSAIPARLFTVLPLLWLLLGAAPVRRSDEGGVAVFSDGRTGEVRSVYTYEQDDGVLAFTDRAPPGRKYRVMKFACYACDPNSRVQWRTTGLHVDKYADVIGAAARRHGVDVALIRAVIHAESGFNPDATSNRGAAGLMQLMPGTAADMGVADRYAVHDNVEGGVKYLAMLLEQYNGDVRLATAAYHAGPTNVQRHGGMPPFPATRLYVERVNILRERYRARG